VLANPSTLLWICAGFDNVLPVVIFKLPWPRRYKKDWGNAGRGRPVHLDITWTRHNKHMEKQNRVGQKAGHLVLKDELGGQVHLADLHGTWLWMIFHRHLG